MESNENIPAEEKPAAAEPVQETPVAEDAPVTMPVSVEAVTADAPKKGFIDRAIPWVIVALVFFLAGAIVVYLTLFQQKVLELKTAQADLVAANENLAAEKSKLEIANLNISEAQTEITNLESELAASQATIEEHLATIAKAEQNAVIYKFQSDVNAARLALQKLDPASSRQALNFVKADLTALKETGIDADAISGFESRIEEALTNLESNPTKSEAAMDTLYSNLMLLINNL